MRLTPEDAAELAVALGWHSVISGPTWVTGFPPASKPHIEDDRDEIPLDLRELAARTREAYQARLHTLEVRYDEQRRMSEQFLKSSSLSFDDYAAWQRFGLAAIEQYRHWRAFGGYDGPVAPNAAMGRIGQALRDSGLTMGNIERARQELL